MCRAHKRSGITCQPLPACCISTPSPREAVGSICFISAAELHMHWKSMDVVGLKGDQLHQTGLTNGRCCESHYPLSQQRGWRDPEILFPHESSIPAEPWETASHSAAWMELEYLVFPHIHNKNTNRHTKAGFELFICLAHGSIEPALEIIRTVCTPLSQSTMITGNFKALEQSSLSCWKITWSCVVNCSPRFIDPSCSGDLAKCSSCQDLKHENLPNVLWCLNYIPHFPIL